MDKIKAIMMDLDGTVYKGDSLVSGSCELIDWFRKQGIRVFFSTNNSEKSRADVSDKLIRLGISCNRDDIISSGFVSAAYAKKSELKSVYVCGTDGLKHELQEQGVDLIEDCYDAKNTIIGMDSKYDYNKLTLAVRAALQSEMIIACNREKVFPGDGGKLLPGCGAMVSSVEYCADKKVDLVIGKPNTIMFEHIKELLSLESNEVLVIGDSLDSDIEMAEVAGAPFIYINDNWEDGGIPMNVVLDFCTSRR